MIASTADNADAADPGADGGTVEVESPLTDGDSRGRAVTHSERDKCFR